MKSNKSSLIYILLIFALGIIGAVFQFNMMQSGVSLREDSYDYITAATNLVDFGLYGRFDGLGNFKLLTQFPPLYPLLLAIPW